MNTKADETQVKVKLPPDLRDWLKHQAINNRRTLVREIEHRLIKSAQEEQRAGATT